MIFPFSKKNSINRFISSASFVKISTKGTILFLNGTVTLIPVISSDLIFETMFLISFSEIMDAFILFSHL